MDCFLLNTPTVLESLKHFIFEVISSILFQIYGILQIYHR